MCVAASWRINSPHHKYSNISSPFSVSLLSACRTALVIFIFIARAFISGGYQVAFLYTPEVSLHLTCYVNCTVLVNILSLSLSLGVPNRNQGVRTRDL